MRTARWLVRSHFFACAMRCGACNVGATEVMAFIWSRRTKCTDEIENQVERESGVHNPDEMTLRAACAMRIFSVRRKAHWPTLGGTYVRFVS